MTQHRKDTSLLCEIDLTLAAAARTTRGWSTPQLAARSGINRDLLYRYESGRTRPTPRTAAAWARTLGVPVGQLVTGIVRNPLGRRKRYPPAGLASLAGPRPYVFPAQLVRPADTAGEPGEFELIPGGQR